MKGDCKLSRIIIITTTTTIIIIIIITIIIVRRTIARITTIKASMVQEGVKEKGNRRQEQHHQHNQEGRRRSKRKQASSVSRSSSSSCSLEPDGIHGRVRRGSKLASHKREHESRGSRTRRRPNGGSLSSRGSATGMQCGLCAVLASLFRRAMCIAGSRRGSGESCYEELATDVQQPQMPEVETQRQQQFQLSGGSVVGSAVNFPTATSRSESFGSVKRLRESPQRERPTAGVTLDSAGQNAVFVRISGESGRNGTVGQDGIVGRNAIFQKLLDSAGDEDASLPTSGASPLAARSGSYPMRTEPTSELGRRLSDTDRVLIESLDIGRCRTRHTGRFLTMHKRRRKRLITRTLNQDPGLLDDIFHGQVQCVLLRAGDWRFNAFTLETVTGGRSLPVLCVHLFQWYGLFQRFNLDVVRVWKLFALIEEGYHSTNPYHNSIHATDVTQAMHCFLQEEKIKRHLSSLEIMASLIAAVTHDLDHPGVNQPFLVATSNHLATLYENTSVLENHHWRSAIGCLLESGVSEQLPAQVRPELQRHISSLILATDITRQQEFLTRFKGYLDKNALDMERPENRHFVLQISLKCADISNPCRPWDISRKWSYKVCEEFFRQGDYERQLNLSVTPLCDRQTISIPKIQAGFFEYVVTPLYEEWHRFLGDGLSVSLMLHLRGNQKRWEALIAQEAAEDTNMEISDIVDQAQNSSNFDDDQASGTRQISGSVEFLLPDAESKCEGQPSLPGDIDQSRRVNRRHSVPLSITKPLSLAPRGSRSRRESLPSEHLKPPRSSLYRLEDRTAEGVVRKLSSVSLLSSRSSVYESTGYASSSYERPVSAENLLPEPSIASITSSVEASRLSTVLQPEIKKSGSLTTKHLTRQQTFPPLQPYVRIRYMSTTAEMSKCRTETLMEAEDSLSSSGQSSRIDESGSDKRCGACSGVEGESSRQKRVDGDPTRVSREHSNGNHRGSRRRESVFSDMTRQSLDIGTPGCAFPRRHSVQAVQSEDPNLLGLGHRHRRPSSAQEAYPTQMLYASLLSGSTTGTNSNVSEIPVSDVRSDLRKDSNNSDCSVGELSISNSPRESRQLASANVVVTESSELCQLTKNSKESELRRYSTPVTQTRIVGNGDSGAGRRFTAIPVTSELSIHKVFFVGTPPESPGVQSGLSSSSDSASDHRPSIGDTSSVDGVPVGAKRDSEGMRQKSFKIPKLSDDGRMKENVDPRSVDESNRTGIVSSRRTSQAWARRRGSAPVGLLARLDDSPTVAPTAAPRIDRHVSRRGSVPTDVTVHQGGSFRAALGPRGENIPLPRRASLPQEAALSDLLENVFLRADDRENVPINNNNNNNNGSRHTSSNNNGSSRVIEASTVSGGMPSSRRGSVPADISELRRDLFGRNSVNGKTRNRKKTLRRRSSGGPEMFAGGNVDDNENGKWPGCKRDLSKRDSIPEPSVKRRGSLPVEMVSIFHPGWYNYR